MADDFRNYNDDAFDETPDWLLDDDLIDTESAPILDDPEDEFDQLRRKSARSGAMLDEMEEVEEMEAQPEARSRSAFSWSSFSPGQRLVLALLIVLDILAIAFGVMVITGFV